MKFQTLILLMLLVWAAETVKGQPRLSDQAQISLLTSSPSDDEVFTLYGHTALRINDPEQHIDVIFNYGIFNFNKPHFIYRFTKGETDYMLGAVDFENYYTEYQMRGSEVTQQVLNLSPEEANRVWNALLMNYQPENREYRYNFFFDNCATRPRDIIEKSLLGKIQYAPLQKQHTFRELISYCTRNHSWLTFGCDLALGAPTDRTATQREELFLPEYLKTAFEAASIVAPDGTKRNLVSTSSVLIENAGLPEAEDGFLTPLYCGWMLFAAIALLTFWEWRKKTYFRIVDILLFFVAGIAGCILFFISFISVHPCTYPNWSLVWLNPLQLLAVILFAVKKLKIAAYYYHFINFVALTLFMLAWHWIPQQFNPAFIPLILTLWIRSGYGVYRYKRYKE